MKVRLPGPWRFRLQPACRCARQSGPEDCTCQEMCAARECTPAGPVPQAPQGFTLGSLKPGQRARIEGLSVPEALRRRLWSLGLTHGTEIDVISAEGGRMIVAVRDSRLGLGPETAARILCRPAWRA